MLKILRFIFLCVPRLVIEFLLYVNAYAKHPERYPLELRYNKIRQLIGFVFSKMRIEIETKGISTLENREGPVFLVSNHISGLDPLIYIFLSPKPMAFVAKIELKKTPFIGKGIKAIDGVLLDREDLRASVKTFRFIETKLRSGETSYAIFPEGTRNKDINAPLLPFHPGSLRPAEKTQTVILPAAIYGSFGVLDRKHDYKRNKIMVQFLDIVQTSSDKEENTISLVQNLQSYIQKTIDKERESYKKFLLENKQKERLPKGKRPYVHEL